MGVPVTQASTASPDFLGWYERWEGQQGAYIMDREERFAAMLDAVETSLGREFTMIDLACGPGAITRRVIDRFPEARVIAVDLDPLLVAIARAVHGDAGGRVQWVEASLLDATWPSQLGLAELGVPQVDAVLSTTAIHWLRAGDIVDLYRTLAGLIRPGGVFANGDQMRFEPTKATITRLADERRATHRARAFADGAESWEAWWEGMRAEAAAADLLAERDRRFAWRSAEGERNVGSRSGLGAEVPHTGYAMHRAALLDAGFAEVDTIWQKLDNRVLFAVR